MLNKNAAGQARGVRKLKKDFQHTGAIPEGAAKMKPRTPMMSGDLPALKL
jgi:hypothetical protein